MVLNLWILKWMKNENLITDNCCYSCFNHFFHFTKGIANHEIIVQKRTPQKKSYGMPIKPWLKIKSPVFPWPARIGNLWHYLYKSSYAYSVMQSDRNSLKIITFREAIDILWTNDLILILKARPYSCLSKVIICQEPVLMCGSRVVG